MTLISQIPMAEAARNLDEESTPEKAPSPKPKLQALEGGGQTTPPKTGHLKAASQEISEEKAPFFRLVDKGKAGWKKVRNISEETGKKVVDATSSWDETMQGVLRAEDPGDPGDEPLLFPPKGLIYGAGDVLDATVLKSARRVWEVTNTTGSAARAVYRTVTRPVFHPIDTIKHPIKYLSNPTRLATSALKLGAHAINYVPRNLDETINRGIKRPLKRMKKIPLLGTPLSIVGGAAGWLANKPRQATEWLTSPIHKADDWVKEKQ